MPKEIIHHGETETIDKVAAFTPSVSLHWSDNVDSCVQFGMKLSITKMREFIAQVDIANEKHGGYRGEDGDDYVTFYTNCISRTDAQRGIKALRRARDATWEADA